MRLLCDEMLAGLARWLRAAGYDTEISAAASSDAALVALAGREGRTLIIRDRALAQHGTAGGMLLLGDDELEQQVRFLARTIGIDWLHAPFTRCLIDNTPLRAAEGEELAQAPEGAPGLPGPFRACPACARLYWPGSHVRRMTARLERWRAGAAGSA